MSGDQYETRRRANGMVAATGKRAPRREWRPTPFSRFLGMVIVVTLILLAMAVAGAIEDPAHGSEPSPYQREVSLWDGLTPLDRAYYCDMPRRDAVLVWAAGMDEGESGIAPRNIKVAKRVLARGCNN